MQRSPLAKRHFRRNLSDAEPSIEIVDYLGCTITLRREVTPGGSIRRSYTVVAPAIGTTWGRDDMDGVVPESADPGHLLEMAKCEIDFALEGDF